MKTIVAINTIAGGSTGRIAQGITNRTKEKYQSFFICGRGKQEQSDYVINKNKFFIWFNSILARLTGRHEKQNYFATKKMLKWLDKRKPDIIHLHNLHGEYINIDLLFRYINDKRINVVWTFHDCWPFTGHCPYFEKFHCDKWKTKCSKCPQFHEYPKSWFFDTSSSAFIFKKRLFTSLTGKMYIVSPSKWLANFAESSFLKEMPIKTINNGIDLGEFFPVLSDFREKYNLQDKIILLGVASPWSNRKGLRDFNLLADMLDSSKYQIVLVGINDTAVVNPKIISIPRQNIENLVKIYSSCDYLINPTIFDNFPTVNIEALACGLPVIAYNTGGCAEQISHKCGVIVEKGNLMALKEIIESNPQFDKNECISWAQRFSQENMTKAYIDLYDDLLSSK